jgi:flagellar hook-basal body complex protein FliE
MDISSTGGTFVPADSFKFTSFVPDIGDETPTETPLAGAAAISGSSTEKSFIDTLKDYAADVNTKMSTAEGNTQDLAAGRTNDLGKVVTSVEEANLAFQFALAVRTKLLTAYQQVSQMQV